LADQRLLAAVLAALVVGIALGYLALGGGAAPAAGTEQPATVTVTNERTIVSTRLSATTVTQTVVTSTVVSTTVTKTLTTERLVLVDALGRTVTLEEPPERLVSLAPSITEEIVMLNASSRLVGVDSFSKNIPGVPADVVDVGGYWSPSPEKIIQAKPDLVLACSGVPAQERLANQLEPAGLKVFFTRCDRSRDWRDIEWDVAALGKLLAAEQAATKLIAWMEESLAGLAESLANVTRPTLALIVYLQDKGAWVAGGGTFQDTVVATAGASNVFHSLYGWQMVGYEEIVAKNPSYIVATTMGDAAAANKTLQRIAATPVAETDAWRSGHVCVAYGDLVDALSRPSPRAVLAAQALAALLHPDHVEKPGSLKGWFICNQPSG